MSDEKVPEKECLTTSKPPSSDKQTDKAKEDHLRNLEKSKEKDKGGGAGKGQRYYLYDQELKRPAENPPSARGYRPRLPFHMNDYHGIYPTNETVRFEREYQEKREREYRIYSRPPDIYHSTPRSPPRLDRSERYAYDGNRTEIRSDYDSCVSSRRPYEGSSSHSPSSSRRHWEDRERESHYHGSNRYEDRYSHTDRDRYSSTFHRHSDSILNGSSRDYYSSSTRRRHSYESGRSRTRSPPSETAKPQPDPKEKERDDYDLDIELHPLMHFIDDKPNLLKEALSILRGKKLNAMIPLAFSHLNPREVEEVCLQELNTLNIATIANVIDGKLVNAELANPQVKSGKSGGISVKKIKRKLKEAITEDDPKKKKRKAGTEAETSKTKKLKKDKKHKKKRKKKSKQLKGDELPAGPGLPPQKTLMELLELEYRAKAIKALLKSQDINSLSSSIDDALLGEPEPEPCIIAPSSNIPPIVSSAIPQESNPAAAAGVIVRPAPPEISTRFLVDNNYVYPMEIKLELEEPPPDYLAEGAIFPPSPDAAATAEVVSPSEIDYTNVEGAAGVVINNPSDSDQDDHPAEPIPLKESLPTDSQQEVEPRIIPPNESTTSDSHSQQPESETEPPPLTDSSALEKGPEEFEVQEPAPVVMMETEQEMIPTNNFPIIDDKPPPPQPRIQILITLDDDSDEDDVTADEDDSLRQEKMATDRVGVTPLPNFNGEIADNETELVDSDLEEGEYGDGEDVEAKYKRSEGEPEVEDVDSSDVEEEIPDSSTYVRRSSDLLVPVQDHDESPRRLPLKLRPEPTVMSRSFPEVEDISSDESSGLEPLKDDGIVIGGYDGDPVSDTEDPIALPPPIHTCEPMPEDYEQVSENSNMGNEEEEEDEETNPRTWFNRWYNSKKVQKNVKSNKMIGKLRSKLRREKLIPEPLPPEPSEEAVPIIGSITEYQTLFSSGKYKVLPEHQDQPEPAVELEKVEEEEGPDDDDLWGDIIG